MRLLIVIPFLLIHLGSFSQSELELKQRELKDLQHRENALLGEIEMLELKASRGLMQREGYPKSDHQLEILEHSGMTIGFDCRYKMAAWVYHILSPKVADGNVTRTNDFRPDDMSVCGSAQEADYFLKEMQEDGSYAYDGFGYDRGHLAPSADFRWTQTALSESYFYSNMTPQHPDFNRDSWASLEGLLRFITIQENRNLHVLTGPILHDSLQRIERGVNQLVIPEWHYKILVDFSESNPRGMAFLMPNEKCEQRLSAYVVPIDSIEQLTGLNFFPDLTEEEATVIESTADFSKWKAQRNSIDVEPLNPLELPKGYFNTRQAQTKEGQKVSIVGKVVSTKYIARSQSTFLNLDQSFPNQIFSVMIWKDGRRNFSYKPENYLDGKYIVVTGVVTIDKNGVPGITVDSEEQILLW